MTKISGVYLNGFGEPVAGVRLVLAARATSASVITTTTAQQSTGMDGSYSFDVQPGVYVVTASGAYLGVINACPDSPDGTLNDYLTNFSADELTPAALAEIQELVKEARDAAAAAQSSAVAAETSKTAAAGSASAAAGSAAAAESAAERAGSAGGVDISTLAKLAESNTFTAGNTFYGATTFNKEPVIVNSNLISTKYTSLDGGLEIGRTTSNMQVSCYAEILLRDGKRLSIHSPGAAIGAIDFYEGSYSSARGRICVSYSKTFTLMHLDDTKFLLDFARAEADGLKFRGKDRVEQTIYHSGYLPPAAVVAGELPAEVTQPVFYFDEAANQLYFLNGDKKYNVTLTPA
ncbi:phage tail protein [Salmonella enterica subsp. enterica serovar Rovaniemi]|nr:phage tail protein [Salmonella enterica subsp. enterica serovar Rovaniemi]